MLLIASGLLFFVGLAHSVLGEKFILIPLTTRDMPRPFNNLFLQRVMRYAWHLTTIAWWAAATVLYVLAKNAIVETEIVLRVFSVAFGVSGLFGLVLTRGKHLSWILFLAVSALCWFSSAAVID